jgi:hypothetical protein
MTVQASGDRAAAVQAIKQKLVSGGIGFALGVWVDTIGRAKAKIVPIEGVDKLLTGRGPLYGVHALDGMGDYGPADPDQSVLPDLDSHHLPLGRADRLVRRRYHLGGRLAVPAVLPQRAQASAGPGG